MLDITKSIINAINFEVNELFTLKGAKFEFNHREITGTIHLGIYQEGEFEPETNSTVIYYQRAMIHALRLFDEEGNAIDLIEIGSESISVKQISDEIKKYYYFWEA